MFVKLNESLINLDLIKEISEVVAFLVHSKKDPENYIYELEPKNVAKWLEISTTGNESQREYDVVFGFKIYYLQEQYPKHIKVSLIRNEAVNAREALATLLNGNKPVIHVVKY